MLDVTPPNGASVRMPVSDRPELDVQWILGLLRRRRAIILAVLGLALLAASAYAVFAPAKYTATTSIVIDTKRFQLQGELMAEAPIDQAAVESQSETIKSVNVARAVVKRLELATDPEFVGATRNLLRTLIIALGIDVEATDLSDEAILQRAVDTFRSKLKVNRVGRSYVLEIEFTALDPQKAAKIANELSEAYIVDQLEARYQASQRTSGWLQERIGELRQQASDAYRAVQDFKQENNIIDSSGKLNSELQLEELTANLSRARGETSQARARLERITAVVGTVSKAGIPDPAVTDVLNNPVITRLRQQYLDVQKQALEYGARYGLEHTAVVNLRNEMAGLQQGILEEVQRIAETIKSDYEIARSREEGLDRQLTDVFKQSSGTRQAQVKLRELETTSQMSRSMYENFLNRYTQSVQQATFPSTEARVITPATPPSGKSSPRTALALLGGIVAGLGLGAGAAFIWDQLDRVVRGRDQLERLGISCLGVIARSGTARRRFFGFQPNGNKLRRSDAPQVLTRDPDPFSPTAETFRAVKVAIDLHARTEKGVAIGIISAVPREGKSTIAVSLAAALAGSGKRTLLIDGDLRNPSLTRLMPHAGGAGLLQILADGVPLQAAAASEKDRFDFVPGAQGIKLAHTADVLSSPAMGQTLMNAREGYRYVIVDLPPVLPIADVQAAAHLFDGFILVTEWGGTTSDQLERVLSASSAIGTRLIGAVLNKANVRAMKRFEGYGNAAYGYYGATGNSYRG